MNASFDGCRMNLARDYNTMVRHLAPKIDEKDKDNIRSLRQDIVGLLCMYSPEDEKDCNCLIDKIKLVEL